MFGLIRVFIGLVILFLSILSVNKIAKKHKRLLVILAVVVTLVAVIALMLMPFENLFITFKSPEASYKYYTFGKRNVALVIEGKESDMVVGGDNSSCNYYIAPKKDGGWKIGRGIDIKKVKSVMCEGVCVDVYKYKKTGEHFVSVFDMNGGMAEVSDSLNSTFYHVTNAVAPSGIEYVTYYAYVSSFHDSYTLKVNDNEITLLEKSISPAYSKLLFIKFKNMAERLCSEDFEEYINTSVPAEWFNMAIDSRHGIEALKKSSYGYCLKDINGDGVEELLLLREDYRILAIYTEKNSEAVLLDSFYYKHSGILLENGDILTVTSSAWNCICFEVRRLNNNGDGLVSVTKFGQEFEDGYYLENESGVRSILDEAAYSALIEKYPSYNHGNMKEHLTNCGVTFIPVW